MNLTKRGRAATARRVRHRKREREREHNFIGYSCGHFFAIVSVRSGGSLATGIWTANVANFCCSGRGEQAQKKSLHAASPMK